MASNFFHIFVQSSEFANRISALTTMRRNLRDVQLQILEHSYPENYDVLMHVIRLTHEIDDYIHHLLQLRETHIQIRENHVRQ